MGYLGRLNRYNEYLRQNADEEDLLTFDEFIGNKEVEKEDDSSKKFITGDDDANKYVDDDTSGGFFSSFFGGVSPQELKEKDVLYEEIARAERGMLDRKNLPPVKPDDFELNKQWGKTDTEKRDKLISGISHGYLTVEGEKVYRVYTDETGTRRREIVPIAYIGSSKGTIEEARYRQADAQAEAAIKGERQEGNVPVLGNLLKTSDVSYLITLFQDDMDEKTFRKLARSRTKEQLDKERSWMERQERDLNQPLTEFLIDDIYQGLSSMFGGKPSRKIEAYGSEDDDYESWIRPLQFGKEIGAIYAGGMGGAKIGAKILSNAPKLGSILGASVGMTGKTTATRAKELAYGNETPQSFATKTAIDLGTAARAIVKGGRVAEEFMKEASVTLGGRQGLWKTFKNAYVTKQAWGQLGNTFVQVAGESGVDYAADKYTFWEAVKNASVSFAAQTMIGMAMDIPDARRMMPTPKNIKEVYNFVSKNDAVSDDVIINSLKSNAKVSGMKVNDDKLRQIISAVRKANEAVGGKIVVDNFVPIEVDGKIVDWDFDVRIVMKDGTEIKTYSEKERAAKGFEKEPVDNNGQEVKGDPQKEYEDKVETGAYYEGLREVANTGGKQYPEGLTDAEVMAMKNADLNYMDKILRQTFAHKDIGLFGSEKGVGGKSGIDLKSDQAMGKLVKMYTLATGKNPVKENISPQEVAKFLMDAASGEVRPHYMDSDGARYHDVTTDPAARDAMGESPEMIEAMAWIDRNAIAKDAAENLRNIVAETDPTMLTPEGVEKFYKVANLIASADGKASDGYRAVGEALGHSTKKWSDEQALRSLVRSEGIRGNDRNRTMSALKEWRDELYDKSVTREVPKSPETKAETPKQDVAVKPDAPIRDDDQIINDYKTMSELMGKHIDDGTANREDVVKTARAMRQIEESLYEKGLTGQQINQVLGEAAINAKRKMADYIARATTNKIDAMKAAKAAAEKSKEKQLPVKGETKEVVGEGKMEPLTDAELKEIKKPKKKTNAKKPKKKTNAKKQKKTEEEEVLADIKVKQKQTQKEKVLADIKAKQMAHIKEQKEKGLTTEQAKKKLAEPLAKEAEEAKEPVAKVKDVENLSDKTSIYEKESFEQALQDRRAHHEEQQKTWDKNDYIEIGGKKYPKKLNLQELEENHDFMPEQFEKLYQWFLKRKQIDDKTENAEDGLMEALASGMITPKDMDKRADNVQTGSLKEKGGSATVIDGVVYQNKSTARTVLEAIEKNGSTKYRRALAGVIGRVIDKMPNMGPVNTNWITHGIYDISTGGVRPSYRYRSNGSGYLSTPAVANESVMIHEIVHALLSSTIRYHKNLPKGKTKDAAERLIKLTEKYKETIGERAFVMDIEVFDKYVKDLDLEGRSENLESSVKHALTNDAESDTNEFIAMMLAQNGRFEQLLNRMEGIDIDPKEMSALDKVSRKLASFFNEFIGIAKDFLGIKKGSLLDQGMSETFKLMDQIAKHGISDATAPDAPKAQVNSFVLRYGAYRPITPDEKLYAKGALNSFKKDEKLQSWIKDKKYATDYKNTTDGVMPLEKANLSEFQGNNDVDFVMSQYNKVVDALAMREAKHLNDPYLAKIGAYGKAYKMGLVTKEELNKFTNRDMDADDKKIIEKYGFTEEEIGQVHGKPKDFKMTEMSDVKIDRIDNLIRYDKPPTPADAAAEIAANSHNPLYRALASELFRTFTTSDFAADKNVLSYFKFADRDSFGSIQHLINEDLTAYGYAIKLEPINTESTVLHELLHLLTFKRIQYGGDNAMDREVLNRFKRLITTMKAKIYPKARRWEGLKDLTENIINTNDIHEFVSYMSTIAPLYKAGNFPVKAYNINLDKEVAEYANILMNLAGIEKDTYAAKAFENIAYMVKRGYDGHDVNQINIVGGQHQAKSDIALYNSNYRDLGYDSPREAEMAMREDAEFQGTETFVQKFPEMHESRPNKTDVDFDYIGGKLRKNIDKVAIGTSIIPFKKTPMTLTSHERNLIGNSTLMAKLNKQHDEITSEITGRYANKVIKEKMPQEKADKLMATEMAKAQKKFIDEKNVLFEEMQRYALENKWDLKKAGPVGTVAQKALYSRNPILRRLAKAMSKWSGKGNQVSMWLNEKIRLFDANKEHSSGRKQIAARTIFDIHRQVQEKKSSMNYDDLKATIANREIKKINKSKKALKEDPMPLKDKWHPQLIEEKINAVTSEKNVKKTIREFINLSKKEKKDGKRTHGAHKVEATDQEVNAIYKMFREMRPMVDKLETEQAWAHNAKILGDAINDPQGALKEIEGKIAELTGGRKKLQDKLKDLKKQAAKSGEESLKEKINNVSKELTAYDSGRLKPLRQKARLIKDLLNWNERGSLLHHIDKYAAQKYEKPYVLKVREQEYRQPMHGSKGEYKMFDKHHQEALPELKYMRYFATRRERDKAAEEFRKKYNAKEEFVEESGGKRYATTVEVTVNGKKEKRYVYIRDDLDLDMIDGTALTAKDAITNTLMRLLGTNGRALLSNGPDSKAGKELSAELASIAGRLEQVKYDDGELEYLTSIINNTRDILELKTGEYDQVVHSVKNLIQGLYTAKPPHTKVSQNYTGWEPDDGDWYFTFRSTLHGLASNVKSQYQVAGYANQIDNELYGLMEKGITNEMYMFLLGEREKIYKPSASFKSPVLASLDRTIANAAQFLSASALYSNFRAGTTNMSAGGSAASVATIEGIYPTTFLSPHHMMAAAKDIIGISANKAGDFRLLPKFTREALKEFSIKSGTGYKEGTIQHLIVEKANKNGIFTESSTDYYDMIQIGGAKIDTESKNNIYWIQRLTELWNRRNYGMAYANGMMKKMPFSEYYSKVGGDKAEAKQKYADMIYDEMDIFLTATQGRFDTIFRVPWEVSLKRLGIPGARQAMTMMSPFFNQLYLHYSQMMAMGNQSIPLQKRVLSTASLLGASLLTGGYRALPLMGTVMLAYELGSDVYQAFVEQEPDVDEQGKRIFKESTTDKLERFIRENSPMGKDETQTFIDVFKFGVPSAIIGVDMSYSGGVEDATQLFIVDAIRQKYNAVKKAYSADNPWQVGVYITQIMSTQMGRIAMMLEQIRQDRKLDRDFNVMGSEYTAWDALANATFGNQLADARANETYYTSAYPLDTPRDRQKFENDLISTARLTYTYRGEKPKQQKQIESQIKDALTIEKDAKEIRDRILRNWDKSSYKKTAVKATRRMERYIDKNPDFLNMIASGEGDAYLRYISGGKIKTERHYGRNMEVESIKKILLRAVTAYYQNFAIADEINRHLHKRTGGEVQVHNAMPELPSITRPHPKRFVGHLPFEEQGFDYALIKLYNRMYGHNYITSSYPRKKKDGTYNMEPFVEFFKTNGVSPLGDIGE